MAQIAGNTEFDDQSRQLALETLNTLAENAPAMIRKFPAFPQRVIPLCLAVSWAWEETVI